MERITVITSMPAVTDPAVDFDALKQKEMEYISQLKNSGVLENFYIKSDKDGAILIFKDLTMDQVVKNIESLPYFPYMVKVEYVSFDKIF